MADLETGLRELRTDHLDIWSLHTKNRPEELPDELFEAQYQAKKAGKIRFAGITTHFNMESRSGPGCFTPKLSLLDTFSTGPRKSDHTEIKSSAPASKN